MNIKPHFYVIDRFVYTLLHTILQVAHALPFTKFSIQIKCTKYPF